MNHLTLPTPLLDYQHPDIQALIAAKGWRALSPYERIGAAYHYVRDSIAFGYNASDDLPASSVLADGIGQCNTKGTLLMALQRGAITGVAYRLAPQSIIHSWVEVWWDGRWVNLEGFILDRAYLTALQTRFAAHAGPFCGFGVATPDLQNPAVDWCGTDTYIQRDGINHDFGVFDTPDDFYARHGVNLSGPKRWLFRNVVRRWMNRNVASIRAQAT